MFRDYLNISVFLKEGGGGCVLLNKKRDDILLLVIFKLDKDYNMIYMV